MKRYEKIVSTTLGFVFIAGLCFGAWHLISKVDLSQLENTQQEVTGLPEATGYLVDTAGVLTTEQQDSLEKRLKSMDTPQHQFAVAVIKTTGGMSIEEYGIKLAEKWKVGYKGLDNGAIVIIATQDRKVRLEIGYGLEGDIPDAVAGRIIRDDMTPLLKAGDWKGAIDAALTALTSKVK